VLSDLEGRPGPGRSSEPRKKSGPGNDSPLKAIVVTLCVCLAASILVTGTAVLLKPMQAANREREREARIAEIVARLPSLADEISLLEAVSVEARVVDLATGRYVQTIDPTHFDQRRAAKDPAQSVAIPAERDVAQIGRRSRFAVVHLVRRDEQLLLVILPVRGHGFGSMLYGYLGLSADTGSVVGLSFYEHGETPGLGALIDDPEWRAQWLSKKVWDEHGKPGLGVAETALEPGAPEAAYLADALTGATWTARGVTNLLRFWLGDDGFGPFLRNIRERRG
jgi:Na+-transporting NADH:ubiquinone oxidoreductase subunit C